MASVSDRPWSGYCPTSRVSWVGGLSCALSSFNHWVKTPLNMKHWQFSLLTQIWNYKNMSTVKSPNRKGQTKNQQTMVNLITVKINVLVPLLTYSNSYSQALTTCISSTHRELQTIKQSHVSLSQRGSVQRLQEQQSCKIRLQVHTFTSWLVKTSTSTRQATRVETSQSMLGAGIPLPDFQKS